MPASPAAEPGPVFAAISAKLRAALDPTHLEVVDESHKHAGHAAMRGRPAGETHFRVTVIAAAFRQKSLVQRHRLVYDALAVEMQGPVHALSITSKTPEEVAE